MEHQSNVRCCRQDTTKIKLHNSSPGWFLIDTGGCGSSLDLGRCRHFSQSIPRHFTDCFAWRRLPPIFLWHIWSSLTRDCQQAHSSELLVLVRYPSLHHGAKELGSIYGVLHDVERPYYATNPRCLVFTWWCLDRRCSSWSKSVHTQRGELGGRGFDDGNDLTCSCSLHRRAIRYARRPQSSLTCHSANQFYGLPLVTRTCHT